MAEALKTLWGDKYTRYTLMTYRDERRECGKRERDREGEAGKQRDVGIAGRGEKTDSFNFFSFLAFPPSIHSAPSCYCCVLLLSHSY